MRDVATLSLVFRRQWTNEIGLARLSSRFTITNAFPMAFAERENMRKLQLTSLVLIATLGARAEAPLVTKVEKAIRNTEPGWHCSRSVWNAPPLLVPSERPLLVSVWDHEPENGKRESVHVNIFQVDSRSDATISLSPVREGKVATGR